MYNKPRIMTTKKKPPDKKFTQDKNTCKIYSNEFRRSLECGISFGGSGTNSVVFVCKKEYEITKVPTCSRFAILPRIKRIL